MKSNCFNAVISFFSNLSVTFNYIFVYANCLKSKTYLKSITVWMITAALFV